MEEGEDTAKREASRSERESQAGLFRQSVHKGAGESYFPSSLNKKEDWGEGGGPS